MADKLKNYYFKENIIRLTRDYFYQQKFHEVDVPILLPSLPLEPNIYSMSTVWQYDKTKLYLITSPESTLKKLIAQGLGNCFAIAHCFRDLEAGGPTHHPEFLMLEWYEMSKNYLQLMTSIENYVITLYDSIHVGKNYRTNNLLKYQNRLQNLKSPWTKIRLSRLFSDFSGIDLSANLDLPSITAAALQKGYSVTPADTWESIFDQIFMNEIEPRLPQDRPLFIYDYPSQISPLCAPCPNDPGFSQRFELYFAGMELANGCTENTDRQNILHHFTREQKFRSRNHISSHLPDHSFAMDSATLPSSAGVGLGLDRLIMLFGNFTHINDILYTPLSKH